MNGFSVGVMLSKVAKSGVKAVVGLIIGFVGAAKLASFGVQIDQEVLISSLTVLSVGLLEGARNWLKTKFNLKWL